MAGNPLVKRKQKPRRIIELVDDYVKKHVLTNSKKVQLYLGVRDFRRFSQLAEKWKKNKIRIFSLKPEEFSEFIGLFRKAQGNFEKEAGLSSFGERVWGSSFKPQKLERYLEKRMPGKGMMISDEEVRWLRNLKPTAIRRGVVKKLLRRATKAKRTRLVERLMNEVRKSNPNMFRKMHMGRYVEELSRKLHKSPKTLTQLERKYLAARILEKAETTDLSVREINLVKKYIPAERKEIGFFINKSRSGSTIARSFPARVSRSKLKSGRMSGIGKKTRKFWEFVKRRRKLIVGTAIGIGALAGIFMAWSAYAAPGKAKMKRAVEKKKKEIEEQLAGNTGVGISLSKTDFDFIKSKKGINFLKALRAYGSHHKPGSTSATIKKAIYGGKSEYIGAINGKKINEFLNSLKRLPSGSVEKMKNEIGKRKEMWGKKGYILTRREMAVLDLCWQLHIGGKLQEFVEKNVDNFPVHKLLEYVEKGKLRIADAEKVLKDIRSELKESPRTLTARDVMRITRPYFVK